MDNSLLGARLLVHSLWERLDMNWRFLLVCAGRVLTNNNGPSLARIFEQKCLELARIRSKIAKKLN
jgi:hypothetical protein